MPAYSGWTEWLSPGRRSKPQAETATGEVREGQGMMVYANAVRAVASCVVASGKADSVTGVVVGAAMRRFRRCDTGGRAAMLQRCFCPRDTHMHGGGVSRRAGSRTLCVGRRWASGPFTLDATRPFPPTYILISADLPTYTPVSHAEMQFSRPTVIGTDCCEVMGVCQAT